MNDIVGGKNIMATMDNDCGCKIKIMSLLELAKSDAYEVCVFGAGFLGKEVGKQILSNYGIQIDYYCDNNEELVGKEIQSGVYCEPINRLVRNKSKTVCFIFVSWMHTALVYEQLDSLGIDNIITYNELLQLDITLCQFFAFMNRCQTAIYTCITGDYDDIPEPMEKQKGVDYYLISDKEPECSTIYKWINVNSIVPNYITDNVLKNRYCKMHPHLFLSEYKYSVYFDGNIVLKGDITECISELKKARIGVAGKAYKGGAYAEALRCMKLGWDAPDKFIRQVKKYWYEGMPINYATFLCGVLVREHNNPVCVKLMKEWWDEFAHNSRRDQISFSYILWKNGFTEQDILLICDKDNQLSVMDNPYWHYKNGKHKGEKTIYLKEKIE